MAEPAPPLNDDSNPTLVSADGGATQSDDCGSNREGAFVLVLQPPVCASSLDRCAAYVKRKRRQWIPDSPPGLYWNGDVDPDHPFMLRGFGQGHGLDVALSSESSGHPASPGADVDGVHSTAEGSTTSSTVPSPASSASACSSPPQTPPDSPNPFSAEAKRASTSQFGQRQSGFIQVKSSHLAGEDDREVYPKAFRVERQSYMLSLTIPYEESNFGDGVAECVVRLHVDTASNTTWTFGDDYCEVVPRYDDKGKLQWLRLQDWIPPQPGRARWTLAPHGSESPANTRPQTFRFPFPQHLQGVTYEDDGIVMIRQSPICRAFKVNGMFYNWSQTRSNVPQTVKEFPGYKFAVAYASDAATANDYTDGILALGPLRQQVDITEDNAEEAFAIFLAKKAFPSDFSRFPSGGHTLWFALRPPWVDPRSDPSILSVNQCPCPEVQFSEKIPIQANAEGHTTCWCVEMLSMKLYHAAVALPSSEGSESQSLEHETLGTVDLVDAETGKGLNVNLDTGASITNFPLAAVTVIRCAIFKHDETDDSSRFYFDIPDKYRRGRKILIDFEFRGEGGSSVTVTGPAMPFLWQETGGLFPELDGGALIIPDRPPYTLGVNFFQTMFVALHHPDGDHERPYVTLAPQEN